MVTLGQDIRYALRALSRRPGFAVVTVIVLALAIGANTTVFSVFNGLFLRPLPYPDGDRLVSVYNSYPKMGIPAGGTSIPDYLDRREQARSLEALALYASDQRTLTGDDTSEQLQLLRASPSLFAVLGVAPALGRGFTDEEAAPGNERVIVLSDELWRTRLGGRPDVIGGDIRLDGERFRIVGVMPEGFAFPSTAVDAWIPFAFGAQEASDARRGQDYASSIGRLRRGASIESLNAELDAIVQRNLEAGRLQFPTFVETTGFTGRAEPWRDVVVGDLEQMLLLLQGIVLAVLLMAAANIANLQLARMSARRKELAVRAALGAARARLARLVIVEALVLAAVGAAGGALLAQGGLALVGRLGLGVADEGFELAMDATVLSFTATAAVLAALLSVVLPLIALMREDPSRVVHQAGRIGGGGREARSVRGALVVVQIAASATLLVGAGLLTKNFYALQSEGAGFDAEGVLTARITLPDVRYGDDESRAGFFERAVEVLRALPGVSEAAFTSVLPFSGANTGSSILIDGYTPPPGASLPVAQLRSISERYLPSLAIPVIRGRNFVADETERVAIVDENLARTYWPGGDALGQRVRTDAPGTPGAWHTIVGVVPAVKHESLAEQATTPTIYWHYAQRAAASGAFVLRTAVPPEQLMEPARDAIRRIDPGLALHDSMPMAVLIDRSLGPQRTPMVLTLVFGAGAFVLAVVGIYAVLTWAVAQRFGEIGVRMALGAKGADVVRMVLLQGARLVIVGLSLGALGALALGRLMQSQIGEIDANDPAVLGAALVGLGLAALFASWLPARRAARIDPMRALREE